MTNSERIPYLLQQYASGKATDEEVEELFQRLRDTDAEDNAFIAPLEQMAQQKPANEHYNANRWQAVLQTVLSQRTQVKDIDTPVIHQRHRWYRWSAAAAVLLLLLAAGAIILTNKKKAQEAPVAVVTTPLNDALPGHN